MGAYRARDLFLVPGLLSAARVPLAIAFPFVLHIPFLALAVLAVSGITDVLDGFLARRWGQVTPTGAALDPVTDKIFVLTVVVTLVVSHQLTPLDVLLLSLREVAELPLVLWVLYSHRARGKRAQQPMANIPGKLVTTLQFATIAATLFHFPIVRPLVIATAIVGVVAAVIYWRRALVD